MKIAWRGTVLRRFHLLVGSLLSVPLVLIGLSGSILVFEPELQASRDFGSASPGSSQSYAAIVVAAAEQAASPGFRASLVTAPETPEDLVAIRFADPRRSGPGSVQVFVDPASLAVRGAVESGEGWLREIFFLHANAMMRDRSGRTIGGWFGVAMCVLALSGIIMQWPRRQRWRQAIAIERGARGYLFLRQLHGAVGFWFWAVLLVVSFSGVWLSFPKTFNGLASSWGLRDLRPGIASARVAPQQGATPLDLDGVVTLAQAARPDLPLRSIALPQRPVEAYRVSLGAPHALPTLVFVDPWARRIVELRDPNDYSLVERLVASMHAIHDGSRFGWIWRALVMLSGLLPALFAVSGMAMWLAKRRLDRAARRERPFLAEAPGE